MVTLSSSVMVCVCAKCTGISERRLFFGFLVLPWMTAALFGAKWQDVIVRRLTAGGWLSRGGLPSGSLPFHLAALSHRLIL